MRGAPWAVPGAAAQVRLRRGLRRGLRWGHCGSVLRRARSLWLLRRACRNPVPPPAAPCLVAAGAAFAAGSEGNPKTRSPGQPCSQALAPLVVRVQTGAHSPVRSFHALWPCPPRMRKARPHTSAARHLFLLWEGGCVDRSARLCRQQRQGSIYRLTEGLNLSYVLF